MKNMLFVLIAVLLVSSYTVEARQNTAGGTCTNKNDVPGDFVNQCALAGGSEVRCSSGTPMCCVKDSQGTRCYDTISDVKRRGPKAGAGQPTPGRVAPPAPAKTLPKQKAPGTAAPAP